MFHYIFSIFILSEQGIDFRATGCGILITRIAIKIYNSPNTLITIFTLITIDPNSDISLSSWLVVLMSCSTCAVDNHVQH